jgi:excisionase family DNA binding protein
MRKAPPSTVQTVAELAEYLKVHPSTIYPLLKARKLPAFEVGSDWRFNREHIDEWRLRQESGWIEASEKGVKKDKPM